MAGKPAVGDHHDVPSHGLSPLSRVRPDELLPEIIGRVGDVVASRARLPSLLDAVVGNGTDLGLNSTPRRAGPGRRG